MCVVRAHRRFVPGLVWPRAWLHGTTRSGRRAWRSAGFTEPVHAEIEFRIRGRRVKHRSGVSLSRACAAYGVDL